MPKSYREFFESTGKKGLTEEQRKPLVNMRALMNSFKTNTLFLEKNAAKQVGTKELTEAEMHEYKEKMSAFRDSFRNASDILADFDRSWNKQPENQATAQKFNTCLNQTINLIHMLQNNDQLDFFDTFMDAGLMLHDPSQEELMTQFYGNQRVPFDMKAQPLFDFLHFMNDNFDAGIDIKAFEDKVAAYQERRAQREIERENRLEEELTEKLRTKMAAASSEFDAAKLWLRGHETYKNAGIAFDQLKRGANMVMEQDLDKIDSLETLQELKDQISQKEIMSAYSEPVRKANKAYFDHKREDGQWNDNVNEIQNKNARNRIKAVKKMDEVADLLDQLTALKAKKLERKIAEKQAKLKTDITFDNMMKRYKNDEKAFDAFNAKFTNGALGNMGFKWRLADEETHKEVFNPVHDALVALQGSVNAVRYESENDIEDKRKKTPEEKKEWLAGVKESTDILKNTLTTGDNASLVFAAAERSGDDVVENVFGKLVEQLRATNELFNAGIPVDDLMKKYETFKQAHPDYLNPNFKYQPVVNEQPKAEEIPVVENKIIGDVIYKEEPKAEEIPIVENKIIGDVIYKEEPLVSIEHDEIDLEDVTTVNAFAGRRKAHAEADIENDDDALEAEEPVIEKPEINADKENPAFTQAVQADRDQLWAICNDIKKKQEITDQHREQFMSSFANILAASIMNESGLTAPGSKAYQEQKNAYAQSLIQDGSLKTMLFGKDTENFNKHLTNAFTKNANGLRFGYMDFLKQFKKDNLTNDKKNPMLELDKNMTK